MFTNVRSFTVTDMAALVLLGIGALQVGATQRAGPASQGASINVLNFVNRVFWSSDTQSSGSLVLHGTCRENGDVIPGLIENPPAGPFSSIGAALTALSRVDPRVSWHRDANGMWRIRDGEVSDGLLRVRLRRIVFKNRARAFLAVDDVLSAPEALSYTKKHHIENGMFFAAGGGLLPGPGSTKGLPRLSGTLRNVTVAEALDHVARFFHTVWVYGECRSDAHIRVVITAY